MTGQSRRTRRRRRAVQVTLRPVSHRVTEQWSKTRVSYPTYSQLTVRPGPFHTSCVYCFLQLQPDPLFSCADVPTEENRQNVFPRVVANGDFPDNSYGRKTSPDGRTWGLQRSRGGRGLNKHIRAACTILAATV